MKLLSFEILVFLVGLGLASGVLYIDSYRNPVLPEILGVGIFIGFGWGFMIRGMPLLGFTGCTLALILYLSTPYNVHNAGVLSIFYIIPLAVSWLAKSAIALNHRIRDRETS